MKRTLITFTLLTAFAIFGNSSYGQQKNTISVVYGTGSDGIFNGAPGAAGYSSRGVTMVGLDYMHHFNKLFSIETGLEYSDSQLLWDYEDAYNPNFRPQKTRDQLLSVPIYANLTFFKYMFVNGGFSVDIETDRPAERIAPEQNGIGMFLGIGGKYPYKHVTVFFNPFFQVHHMVSFDANDGRNLMNSGFKFGIGYNF